ncbi:MAG: hydantoinase/oxoprolinase family protein, partial [Alphaproteobacteria bacterium]|nr:hydantoinase/oxoprolinase family protein [Alphaproteobacteria bacterium]
MVGGGCRDRASTVARAGGDPAHAETNHRRGHARALGAGRTRSAVFHLPRLSGRARSRLQAVHRRPSRRAVGPQRVRKPRIHQAGQPSAGDVRRNGPQRDASRSPAFARRRRVLGLHYISGSFRGDARLHAGIRLVSRLPRALEQSAMCPLDDQAPQARPYRIGVDIGGTFTDIVLIAPDGTLFSKKLLSTPADYSEAIESGVVSLLAETGIAAAQIGEFFHGTTVATNAIIERKGAKVALITTEGFRDILELGRFRAPRLYDLTFRKPEPLVERRLRFEVPERMGADGAVVRELDLGALERISEAIESEGIGAVAVCFINAYANPANENAAVRFLAQRLPAVSVSASSQLLPQIQEYERTSTTVVNAYLRPVVGRYIGALEARLARIGIAVPLMIMQSSGGVLPGQMAAENPIYIIESGPAAGVVGAQRLGAKIALGDVMVLDMGGTTAKAAIIEDGKFGVATETEVGGGAQLGHRLIQGAGYVVQVPTIDIAEVGAGGGSIATIDTGGSLKVGPEGAGATPGPVCYGRGGERV